jgi:RNA polymerase sigma-70 factor (ECF subfamily)
MKSMTERCVTSDGVARSVSAGEPPGDDFEAGLAKLRPLLYQRAMFLVSHDKTTADDLTHDTIQRALESRDRFQRGTNLLAWSFSVMRNLFIDAVRRNEHRRTVEVRGAAAPTVPCGHREDDGLIEPPSAAANDNDGRSSSSPPIGPLDVLSYEDILAVVSTLRPAHREIFALAYRDRLPHQEIADRLGIPRSTADTRLRRVRLALRGGLHRIYRDRMTSASRGHA